MMMHAKADAQTLKRMDNLLRRTAERVAPDAPPSPDAYSYWKRLTDRFQFVKVDVYALEVKHQLETGTAITSDGLGYLPTRRQFWLMSRS
jgi:hypothetical protein